MSFCSKCGTEVAEGINFCGKCGNPMADGQTTRPTPIKEEKTRTPKEIKSINVAPSQEEATINHWMIWGWDLKSTQTVKTQDVQTYTGQNADHTTSYYETKKGEHYVKLTFERDKSMPNYTELCELERKYNEALNDSLNEERLSEPSEPFEPTQEKPGCWAWGCSAPIVILGIIWVSMGIDDLLSVGIISIIIGIAIPIIAFAIKRSAYNKDCTDYTDELEIWEKENEDWKRKSIEFEKRRDDFEKKRNECMVECIKRARSLVG